MDSAWLKVLSNCLIGPGVVEDILPYERGMRRFFIESQNIIAWGKELGTTFCGVFRGWKAAEESDADINRR